MESVVGILAVAMRVGRVAQQIKRALDCGQRRCIMSLRGVVGVGWLDLQAELVAALHIRDRADGIRKRAGWLCVLFLSEMLTASAMQYYQAELERAIVLTLFIPLIMSSGGNSGSQATSLIIRSLALREITLRDWWRIAARELPAGLVLGAILGIIGIVRIGVWQRLGLYDYGTHWSLVALILH